MVEQAFNEWVRQGGRGIPMVLLPEQYGGGEVFQNNRIIAYTDRVTKALVVSLEVGTGLLFGSIEVAEEDDDE